ncbi:MAG: hypothetical protein ACRD0V_02760 [Acidimicrobiales bacterium]
MAHPAPTSPGSLHPFDALDAEWALLCRRNRRSAVVARWAQQQPVLASLARLDDVIPPPDADRRPYCQALAALAAGGDDLAARALLQLLGRGLVHLAAQWRWQLEGITATGWELIARAGIYIARLRTTEVTGTSPAGYCARSNATSSTTPVALGVPAASWPSTTRPATPRRSPATTRPRTPRTPCSADRSCVWGAWARPTAAPCPPRRPGWCCCTPLDTRCPTSPAERARHGPVSTACATGATPRSPRSTG